MIYFSLLLIVWASFFRPMYQNTCSEDYFTYEKVGINKLSFEYKSLFLDSFADQLITTGKISQGQSDTLKSVRFFFEMDIEKDDVVVRSNLSNNFSQDYIGLVNSMENMLRGFSELWAFLILREDSLVPENSENKLNSGEFVEYDSECVIKSVTTEVGTIYPLYVKTDQGLVVARINYYDENSSIEAIIEYALSNSVYYPKNLLIMTKFENEVYPLSFTMNKYSTN